MTKDEREKAEAAARRAHVMEFFYFAHVPGLVASVVFLDFETFTKVSLLYTTIVSAITAAATYGAKRKASQAESAAMT
jgi:hypothetical protein